MRRALRSSSAVAPKRKSVPTSVPQSSTPIGRPEPARCFEAALTRPGPGGETIPVLPVGRLRPSGSDSPRANSRRSWQAGGSGSAFAGFSFGANRRGALRRGGDGLCSLRRRRTPRHPAPGSSEAGAAEWTSPPSLGGSASPAGSSAVELLRAVASGGRRAGGRAGGGVAPPAHAQSCAPAHPTPSAADGRPWKLTPIPRCHQALRQRHPRLGDDGPEQAGAGGGGAWAARAPVVLLCSLIDDADGSQLRAPAKPAPLPR